MTLPIAAPFDELDALQGLVSTLGTFLADDIGVMLNPKTGAETTTPAIYIGGGQVPSATYPRVILQYQGSSGGYTFDSKWAEVEDPDDPPNTIEVPYYDQYLTYIITVTVQAGSMDEVLESYVQDVELSQPRTRISSEKICRKIRNQLMIKGVRDLIHTDMNSTVRYDNIVISPTFPLGETQIQNNSVMSISFDTIDRVYDYSSRVFATIEREGDLLRTEDDPDPLTISGSVGPVTP